MGVTATKIKSVRGTVWSAYFRTAGVSAATASLPHTPCLHFHSFQVPRSAKPRSFRDKEQLYEMQRERTTFSSPPAPSYFEDHLFLTFRLPNFMFQACVIPYCSFENKWVFCDGPKRGSALRKKHRRMFFCPGVSLFCEGAQRGAAGRVRELALCFYPAEMSLEEVDLILPGLQLSNAYQNVFLSYII